jgi:nucleotide-binding universal stress UspA family protein
MEAEVHSHFTGVAEDVKTSCDVLKGPLLDRLLEYTAEQEVDLLLVGHRHNRPGRGSLARRLAMKAPCSLWMVPEDVPVMLDRILVPIDFSDHAADTMRVAIDLARLSGTRELLALHVYFDETHVTYEDADLVTRGHELEAFERFMAPIDRQGVRVAPLFVEGSHPAETIHRVAAEQGVDLKVMGTRGRSRSAAVLLGSVTEGVLMHARTPVFVVKHFGAQITFLQALLDRAFSKKGPQFD